MKYNPPKLTITYHFENQKNQEFFHDIPIDKKLLLSKSIEDFVSHLYVTEAYYFNPKQVKRSQLIRLVDLLKENVIPHDDQENYSANKQINI